jgi:hypothetical protein
MKKLIWLLPLTLVGCASVNSNNNYGFNPGPGMQEDAQDRNNAKYNMMDSPDGRRDPNANVKLWGATY